MDSGGVYVVSGGFGNSGNNMNNNNNNNNSSSSDSHGRFGSIGMLIRRLIHPPQLDMEMVFSQMVYLLSSPRKVYKLTSWRNQTKHQWARDDPAFLVVLCGLIFASTFAYALAFGVHTAYGFLWAWSLCFLAFFVSGILISTTCWYIANSRFQVRHSHSVDQEVEWLYAFDIHCNSFFPVLVLLGPLQYALLPFLYQRAFIAALVSNCLYGIALGYYWYVTFLGYLYLPFLSKGHVTGLLYPIAIITIVLMFMTMLRFNSCVLIMHLLFV